MLSRSYALPLNGIKAKVFVLSRRVSYKSGVRAQTTETSLTQINTT